MVGHQNYSMILQSSENSKEIERDMNTLEDNTLGLLREVRNFILFRIHSCIVQWSLNKNIIFILYCFRKTFFSSIEQTTINHGFWIVIHISMCAEIYSLYVLIDMFDILIVFIKSEKWRTIKRLCRDWYIHDMLIVWFRYVFRTLELKYTVLLTLYRLSITFSIPVLFSCAP